VTVPDGSVFDVQGNLNATTYGSSCICCVTQWREVTLVGQDVENELLCLVSNCAFAGPNFDQLIVANLGHTHLSVLGLGIKSQTLWSRRHGYEYRS
jgi:sugar lactone lactonase YvrE